MNFYKQTVNYQAIYQVAICFLLRLKTISKNVIFYYLHYCILTVDLNIPFLYIQVSQTYKLFDIWSTNVKL